MDKCGDEIFIGQFVQVRSRPKDRYMLAGVISESNKKNNKFIGYDVKENFCPQVYYSSLLCSTGSATPSEEQLEAMEKCLTVILNKSNNCQTVIGLKPMSKKGDCTYDTTKSLLVKSKY